MHIARLYLAQYVLLLLKCMCQPWLYATQSQNTALQCGLDPATQISSTPNFTVQCAWFQAACNPCSCHGCQCSAVLHLLYAIKQQLTICFKSSKPIQTGLCMLMSLSIHLHGLHLDAQICQTWHLSTQLHSGERTGRRLLWSTTLLLPTLLSSSYMVSDEPFPDRSRPMSC